MGIASRLGVATFTVLLSAAWTVPVCCLSMREATAAAAPMSGHQHHHHLKSTESDNASNRLTANESCAQNCQPLRGMVAVSVSDRGNLSLQPTIALVVAPTQATVLSPRIFNIDPSSPPGATLAFSHRALPLRI